MQNKATVASSVPIIYDFHIMLLFANVMFPSELCQ